MRYEHASDDNTGHTEKRNRSRTDREMDGGQKKTRHEPANAPRGHPTEYGTISPSERSRCRHLFVVLSHPKRLGDLDAHALGCHVLDGDTFSLRNGPFSW